jgi:hypothetical protein
MSILVLDHLCCGTDKSEATDYITTLANNSILLVRHHPITLCGTSKNHFQFSNIKIYNVFSIEGYELEPCQRQKKSHFLT